MARRSMALMLLVAILSVDVVQAFGASVDVRQEAAGNSSDDQSVNQVVQWNRTLLVIVRTAGAQPPTIHTTRSFAMMHAAIYDAVNAIARTAKPYLVPLTSVSPSTSQDAAAAAAAHGVLVALYPSFQAMLDAQLQQSLAQIQDGADKTAGISIGETVAERIVALRSTDGSDAQPIPFVFGTAPGEYQSTPPNFPKQPQFTHWSHVTPFALAQADQFRPGPPPVLTSQTYSSDLYEVQVLGVANSTASSADEALTGRFWNGAIQNYWNEITQTAVLENGLTTEQSARLFALLNITLADSVIAFYDAKYTYDFWRPVSAIRGADTDNNSDTVADPNWLPEVGNTTPDPSYPGAHAVISAAAATVLTSFLKQDQLQLGITSEVLPGVVRTFQSLSAAANEATLSRIFAGVHFRSDLTAGQALGDAVAQFVVDNFLTPVASPCIGDCDGAGAVSVSDLVLLVNIALGTHDIGACPAGSPDGGPITIAAIIAAVNNALNGCPV